MAPPISIVINVYNRKCYLSAAIESILTQTRHDFELLIWDDGSTDGAVDIAREYAKRDQRIQVVAAEHQGLVTARKAAIAATTGTYICWLDGDDSLAPTALEETSIVLDTYPEVGLVYTDHIEIDQSGKLRVYGQRCRIPYTKDRLLLYFMTFHFRSIRRSVFDQVGGIDESLPYAEDYDLCLRLSEVTQVWHIKKPLYYYRIHPENISQQKQPEQFHDARQAIDRAIERRRAADRTSHR